MRAKLQGDGRVDECVKRMLASVRVVCRRFNGCCNTTSLCVAKGGLGRMGLTLYEPRVWVSCLSAYDSVLV